MASYATVGLRENHQERCEDEDEKPR
eukprot:COSAG02_NODE_40951_length_399_cov_1.670000_2_plen_25_part_01